MKKNALTDLLHEAYIALSNRRLADALASLGGAASVAAASYDLRERIEQIQQEYNYLIGYLRAGMIDPEQRNMRAKFLCQTADILTTLSRNNELQTATTNYATTWKTLRLMNAAERSNHIMQSNLTDEALFDHLWTSPLWNKTDTETYIADYDTLTANEKYDRAAMMISGVMMAVLSYFDPGKVRFLIHAYNSPQPDHRARALVGLVLGAVNHKKLLPLYPETEAQLTAMLADETVQRHLLVLQLQLIITLETRNIARTLSDDIMPEVMKTAKRMKMDKHFNLDKGFRPEDMAALNPEWENSREMDKVMKGIHHIIDIRRRGGDVLMPLFRSVMQEHPFFGHTSAWFTPFNVSRAKEKGILPCDEKTFRLLEGSLSSHTDRYAICFIMERMQAGGMQTPFDNLSKQFGASEPDTQETSNDITAAIRATVSDLYRYFALFRHRDETRNPFRENLLLTEHSLMHDALLAPHVLRAIADACFEEKNYAWALMLYERLEDTAEILQKTGFCHQQCRHPEAALCSYERALLLDADSEWTYRQMAVCYKQTGSFDRAYDCLRHLYGDDTEDVAALLRMADCLLRSARYQEALPLLFKAEYLDAESGLPLRALAWCTLLTERMDASARYYQRILELSDVTAEDYLNAGHEAWLNGDLPLAVKRYRESLRRTSLNEAVTVDNFFKTDAKLLLDRGFDTEDLLLMVDAIREN